MSKFSLAPYTLRLKSKDVKDYLLLGDVCGLDFLDFFDEYLSIFLSNYPIDNKAGEVVKVIDTHKKNRTIYGLLEAGKNGYGSKLLNTSTDTISYERELLDAELIPYYFLVRMPSKSDKGVVILQRFHNLGIKTLFFRRFNQYLNTKFPDIMLEINPLVPKGLIREYINGRIVKIRLIKQGFPKDIADVSSEAMPDDHGFDGKCEMVLSASKNGYFPDLFLSNFSRKIDKFLDPNGSDTSIGDIIEMSNFDYENIKIEVKIGNTYKTVNLSENDKIRYYEDISGIEVNVKDGHPKFDIIDDRAKSFLKDLAMSIWGDNVDA